MTPEQADCEIQRLNRVIFEQNSIIARLGSLRDTLMVQIRGLDEKVVTLNRMKETLLEDWADDDTCARKCAKELGIDVEGDRWHVPGITELIEAIAFIANAERIKNELLTKNLQSTNDLLQHSVKEAEEYRDTAHYWQDEFNKLNPLPRSQHE